MFILYALVEHPIFNKLHSVMSQSSSHYYVKLWDPKAISGQFGPFFGLMEPLLTKKVRGVHRKSYPENRLRISSKLAEISQFFSSRQDFLKI